MRKWLSCLILLLVSCSDTTQLEDKAIKIGEVIGLESNDNMEFEDEYYHSSKPMPKGATEKTYLGKGWYSFKLKGECFLLASYGRASVLATADICK